MPLLKRELISFAVFSLRSEDLEGRNELDFALWRFLNVFHSLLPSRQTSPKASSQIFHRAFNEDSSYWGRFRQILRPFFFEKLLCKLTSSIRECGPYMGCTGSRSRKKAHPNFCNFSGGKIAFLQAACKSSTGSSFFLVSRGLLLGERC